jgi:hypothetical protein
VDQVRRREWITRKAPLKPIRSGQSRTTVIDPSTRRIHTTATNVQKQHPLDVCDALLAGQRPFGESDYLHDQLQIRYSRRLARIAGLLPVAGELSRALERSGREARYRVVGDPVVRHTIQQALRRVVSGTSDGLSLAECEEVFRETIGHLEEGKLGGPLVSGAGTPGRLGAEPFHGWLWSEQQRDDVFGRTFRRIVSDYFHADPPCTPSAADVGKLAKGAKLLGVLLPLCSRSVFSHTHVVVIVPHVGSWTQKGSCSEFGIGGTIFLNREWLGNPWWVAEHLLHESLHQKLYDFRQTHSLLAQDLAPASTFPKESAATVYSIWNAGGEGRSNNWDTFRAVAAFHVYVHLAVFCAQAERRKRQLVKLFGAPDASFPTMASRPEALERAQYLGRKIKESCWQELGPAGRLLVDWLTAILNAIDHAPPPPESSYIHLLLHRYLMEAMMVAGQKRSPEPTPELAKLVNEEAEIVRQVLSAIDARRTDLDRLDDAVVRRPDEGEEAAFLRFRRLVAEILRRSSPDGYGFRRPSTAQSIALDKTIQAMVDSSTRRLTSLWGGGAVKHDDAIGAS